MLDVSTIVMLPTAYRVFWREGDGAPDGQLGRGRQQRHQGQREQQQPALLHITYCHVKGYFCENIFQCHLKIIFQPSAIFPDR